MSKGCNNGGANFSKVKRSVAEHGNSCSPVLPVVRRVPGLPIRDCAKSCNNREHTETQLSAIHVTAKAFFERLYLVLRLNPFEPRVKCPYAPTPPPLAHSYFLISVQFMWPLVFCQHTIHPVIWQSPGPFIPKLFLRLLWFSRRTVALFSQIRTFPQLFRFCSDLGNPGIRQIVRDSMLTGR